MIHFHQVTKAYGEGTPVLQSLSFEIGAGQLAALIGPSGCGKSSTLSLINRLSEPTEGTVCVEGLNVTEMDPVTLRRRIGFVFQGIGLFPHLTVAENIGITPRLLRWAREEIDTRVRELLELVRLPIAYLARLPRELSGGEQQRVAVARALAARPGIMLMDEPFGALDPLVRDELGADYRTIHQQLGLTTVLVTHDMTEALLLADKIFVMRSGEIVQVGSAQELLNAPADAFVRSLIETPRRRAKRLAEVLNTGAVA